MKEDKLSELSMQLSVDILKLATMLRSKHETTIANQISRSATSICANIAESKYGHSRADFIAILEIALKEASETEYWLELLMETGYITQKEGDSILLDCQELLKMITAILKSTKANRNNK